MSDTLWRWYQGTRFSKHRVVAPFVLGAASGFSFGPILIGAAVPGI